jgi:hypothetical protein
MIGANRGIALCGRYGGFAASQKVAMLPGHARLEICQRGWIAADINWERQ